MNRTSKDVLDGLCPIRILVIIGRMEDNHKGSIFSDFAVKLFEDLLRPQILWPHDGSVALEWAGSPRGRRE